MIAALAALLSLILILGPPQASASSHQARSHATSAAAKAASSTGAAAKALTKLRKTLGSDLTHTSSQGSALVYDERTGQTLYSYDANTGRLPASVEKLYTTSTALFEFGPNARLRTRVYGVGTLESNGTWDGTLYLKGGGDPTFGSERFDSYMYGTGTTVQALAADLKQAGVRAVDGRVIGDESYFDSLRGGPDTDYQANLETEGELSALAFDAGFTNLDEDKLQPHPVISATDALVSAMRGAGIKVPSSTRVGWGKTPTGAKLITSISSPKISTLLELTNSPSDNFFAEMLLKGLGAKFGAGGTTADGAAVVRSVLASRLGLDPQLNDGSGLSRYDHTTATQVVSLLRQMQGNSAFYNSLAIAGVRGTMVDEMVGTRGADNCRGKTGTLHDVANLVGYCTARNGDPLVFAFLMNGLGQDSEWGHEVEDDMAVALANYNP